MSVRRGTGPEDPPTEAGRRGGGSSADARRPLQAAGGGAPVPSPLRPPPLRPHVSALLAAAPSLHASDFRPAPPRLFPAGVSVSPRECANKVFLLLALKLPLRPKYREITRRGYHGGGV